MKETKRKAFNFMRSYFDVLNELEKDKDKLAFLLAVINKQFLNEDPELTGMAKFAYISQINAIEKSVKGWQDATGQALTGAYQDPLGSPLGSPSQQEKEEEKEEEKEQKLNVEGFLNWFNSMKKKYCGKEGRFMSLTDTDVNNLKKLKKAKYSPKDFEDAFKAMSVSKWAKDNKMIIPAHYLRNDNFVKYLNSNIEDDKQQKAKDFLNNL